MTVTLACGASSGLLHQIIFAGKTVASLPVSPLFPNQTVTHSATHWATEDSLVQMIDHVDRELNPNGERRDWLCVLDCAPGHIAAPWRARMAADRPWVKLCYIAAGFTASCQPLDLAYMKSFKASLQRHAGVHFAKCIMATVGPQGVKELDLKNAILKQTLLGIVAAACADVNCDKRRQGGWHHLMVPAEEHDAVLMEAEAAHSAGELFPEKEKMEEEEVGAEVALLDGDVEAEEAKDAEEPQEAEEAEEPKGAEEAKEAEEPKEAEEAKEAEEPKKADKKTPQTWKDMALMERLMALRLIYGRGPPASHAASSGGP